MSKIHFLSANKKLLPQGSAQKIYASTSLIPNAKILFHYRMEWVKKIFMLVCPRRRIKHMWSHLHEMEEKSLNNDLNGIECGLKLWRADFVFELGLKIWKEDFVEMCLEILSSFGGKILWRIFHIRRFFLEVFTSAFKHSSVSQRF